jgi:RNA polymerase sigma-70 factor (ECF subfamily)
VTRSLKTAKSVCLSRAASGEQRARHPMERDRNAQIDERGRNADTNQSFEPANQCGVEEFQEMFLAARPKFVKVAWGVLRNNADAEDAVQNAFVSAYRHLGKFEGRSNLKTWFTRIVINAALMLKRKQRTTFIGSYTETGTTDDEISWTEKIPTSTPNPERIYAKEERFELINSALARLKPVLRQAFKMTYYDEMSNREACAALGISCGTLKARLLRARLQLFRQLQRKLKPRVRSIGPSLAAYKRAHSRPIASEPAEPVLVELAS